MATGLSLHIGVDEYNRKAYGSMGNLLRSLPNCGNDAIAKMGIAKNFSFKSAKLVNHQATWENVTTAISAAADFLEYGDFFFLSFSGHGSRILDRNSDEDDGYDETWCLYDRILADDDLYEYLMRFRPGVRVLIIADSCHSGTSAKNWLEKLNRRGGKFPQNKTGDIQATCLLMAACQDKQTTSGGANLGNSLYTHLMLQVLKENNFCKSYKELHERISAKMPAKSQPNLFPFGPGARDFIKRRPFKI